MIRVDNIENDLNTMRIKIIARICIYCLLLFSIFLFVAVKIDSLYGLGLIIVFILILFFFTIPAYRTRLGLSKKFCHDIIKSSDRLALLTFLESNTKSEIHINIYSFDSKFGLVINAPLDSLEIIEKECLSISNEFSEILKKYDSQKDASGHVNFDSLLVGMIAILLLDHYTYCVKISLKLSVRGYNESFSFMDDHKRDIIRSIKHSLVWQSL